MSDFKNKNNVVYLHKNKYKTADKHPHFKGKGIVENVEKDISCWVNEGKSGQKYLRIIIDEPYNPDNTNVSTPSEFEKEDIPF